MTEQLALTLDKQTRTSRCHWCQKPTVMEALYPGGWRCTICRGGHTVADA